MAWINPFPTSVRRLPTLIFPYRSTERKPFNMNFTNLLAHYERMLHVISLLFPFFDIFSDSFYTETVNGRSFILSQSKVFFSPSHLWIS